LPPPYKNDMIAKSANNGLKDFKLFVTILSFLILKKNKRNQFLNSKKKTKGAVPPDLSLFVGAREGGVNYVFSLLIGYRDEIPPGVVLGQGQSFNAFFEGGVISMPPLRDGMVNYPDGTPATVSQMAKDVTEFFNWALQIKIYQWK
ncbi:cytochrome C1/Cyt1, partial [Reticulomyxa filosa]